MIRAYGASDTVGSEVLEMTADNFRQRLAALAVVAADAGKPGAPRGAASELKKLGRGVVTVGLRLCQRVRRSNGPSGKSTPATILSRR
jgi:hypothetical protein